VWLSPALKNDLIQLLVPCEVPKPNLLAVSEVPLAPLSGEGLVMRGVWA
jgi:hypothetical protein